MSPDCAPKTRSVWPTLLVKIDHRKKWAWNSIVKPAEPHRPWNACYVNELVAFRIDGLSLLYIVIRWLRTILLRDCFSWFVKRCLYIYIYIWICINIVCYTLTLWLGVRQKLILTQTTVHMIRNADSVVSFWGNKLLTLMIFRQNCHRACL